MKMAMVVLAAAIFMALGVSPAFSDLNIFFRAGSSEIQTVSENNDCSREIVFEDGKAVLPDCGDFYFAIYNGEALKRLVQDDSTKVFFVPYGEGVVPYFGNLYVVLKNIFGSVGTDTYGLEAETFYVWPVVFPASGMRVKGRDGVVRYKGIVPFGDSAIETMKQKGWPIKKDFFTSFKTGK